MANLPHQRSNVNITNALLAVGQLVPVIVPVAPSLHYGTHEAHFEEQLGTVAVVRIINRLILDV